MTTAQPFQTPSPRGLRLAAPLGLLLLLGACAHPMHEHAQGHPHGAMHSMMHRNAPAVTATLRPASGAAAAGTVRFEQHGRHVMVYARVTGLTPNQEHGFHVHERGDCSAPDATSAGGHFNPTGAPHGHPAGASRHAGDMPNLRADSSGIAEGRFHLDGITIGRDANGIAGRSVVVHASADDYTSQPAGNSGDRIACGLIE